MKLKINKLFFFFLIFLLSFNLNAKNLFITGLSKLNINDLQTQTSIDLNKSFYTDDDINALLKDLYKSDLIFDLKYKKEIENHTITIEENKLIENIYVNGNQIIDDEILLLNISMKINSFINKNYINEDINLIKSI